MTLVKTITQTHLKNKQCHYWRLLLEAICKINNDTTEDYPSEPICKINNDTAEDYY